MLSKLRCYKCIKQTGGGEVIKGVGADVTSSCAEEVVRFGSRSGKLAGGPCSPSKADATVT